MFYQNLGRNMPPLGILIKKEKQIFSSNRNICFQPKADTHKIHCLVKLQVFCSLLETTFLLSW